MSDITPLGTSALAADTTVGDAAAGEVSTGEGALEAVFRSQYGALVGLARLLVDGHGEAEELVQEAFARTYASRSRLQQREEPLPYLRRTVVNLARGRLRRRATVRRRPLEPVADAAPADEPVVRNEEQAAVLQAVRALPERQRECVVLRYLLDCSTAETADALGISEGTVKTHLHRALAALESALEDHR